MTSSLATYGFLKLVQPFLHSWGNILCIVATGIWVAPPVLWEKVKTEYEREAELRERLKGYQEKPTSRVAKKMS